MQHTSWFKN